MTIAEFLAEMSGEDDRWPNGVGIHAHDSVGDTPLHWALWRCDRELARALVEAGVDVESPGEDGYTPLHVAAAHCDADIVRLLLRAGARWDKVNEFGESPRDLAALSEHEEVRKLGVEQAS